MLREEGHVEAEAEIRVMCLYTEQRQGVLAAPPEAGRRQQDLP